MQILTVVETLLATSLQGLGSFKAKAITIVVSLNCKFFFINSIILFFKTSDSDPLFTL